MSNKPEYAALVEVPGDLNVNDKDADGNFLIGNDAAWEISQLFTYWPALITQGTEIVDGKKLMACRLTPDAPKSEVKLLIEILITGYSLTDWELLGLRTVALDEAIIENPGTDEEYISGYQSEHLMDIDRDRVLQYVTQQYLKDADGNIISEVEKDINQIHRYKNKKSGWRI